MPDFADLSLTEIVDAVASRDPTPRGGTEPGLDLRACRRPGRDGERGDARQGTRAASNSRIASSDVLIPVWLRLDQDFKGGRAAVLFGGDHALAVGLSFLFAAG